MQTERIKVGDTVKWSAPADPIEAGERYVVKELMLSGTLGDRLLMEYVCTMAIRPMTVARIGDVARA